MSSSLICQTPNLPGVFRLVHVSTERRLYCSHKYVCLLLDSNYRGFWSIIAAKMLRNKQFLFAFFHSTAAFLVDLGRRRRIDILRFVFFFFNIWGYCQLLKYSLNQIVILPCLISPHPCRSSPSVSGLPLLCPYTFMSTVSYGSCRSSLLISSFSSYSHWHVILSLLLNFFVSFSIS